MLTIIHSPKVKPKIKFEMSIYAPDDFIYFIPKDGFQIELVKRFQITVYHRWVGRFLKLFGIKGEIRHFKGYRINE